VVAWSLQRKSLESVLAGGVYVLSDVHKTDAIVEISLGVWRGLLKVIMESQSGSERNMLGKGKRWKTGNSRKTKGNRAAGEEGLVSDCRHCDCRHDFHHYSFGIFTCRTKPHRFILSHDSKKSRDDKCWTKCPRLSFIVYLGSSASGCSMCWFVKGPGGKLRDCVDNTDMYTHIGR